MGLRRVSEEFYPAAKALYMEAFNCSEKEFENSFFLNSRMQPKAKKKAKVAKQSKTAATAMQAVARPFKPITAWLTSQSAAKLDASLASYCTYMAEDTTEQPSSVHITPQRVVPVSKKGSHQRSKRRDRRLV